MKNTVFIMICLLGTALPSLAQDIITTKVGERIEAKVLEIDSRDIRYRLYDEPDGVVYRVPKQEILTIRYESGRIESFSGNHSRSQDGNLFSNGGPSTVATLAPGMKYRELKSIYRPSDYVPVTGGPYSPGLAGVLSFIIPGLGQMVCDELGRGFGYLGGSIGLALVSGVSLAYSPYSGTAAILALAGSIGLLTLNIAAIVNAVKVAKVKNMYVNDLRQTYACDVRLGPSVEYVPSGSGLRPVMGMALTFNF